MQQHFPWKRLNVDAPPTSCPPCHYFCPEDLLMSNGSAVRVFTETDGTENITLTADTGGKDRKPIQFWHQCGGPGGSKTLELQHRVTSTFATRVIHNIQTLYKASIICWIINANMLGKINLITLIWLIFPRPTHTSASKCCPLNDNLLPLYNPKLSNFTCLLVMYYSQMHWKLGI